jgi:hypothetical protein
MITTATNWAPRADRYDERYLWGRSIVLAGGIAWVLAIIMAVLALSADNSTGSVLIDNLSMLFWSGVVAAFGMFGVLIGVILVAGAQRLPADQWGR